ncbi:NAD-dependent epimerase/dehydratase family protein [Actinacidiphila acidipaludis]|uniref:NAD-dependent epimerase/dehydratase family protein n=1 Tax=Actinacidiphila acidipaludis TaxID=2873382 RepID=A0ABS7Q5F9_9ACTN|nr:NAD-dependent epimerase/dehydratase family protein [Streptomyces acidipaludis]MBY8878337.1 NAD-dependent epimerase/dehydratase family protein [Streptomyces acidipaludis]
MTGTALVIGASGQIGRQAVRALAEDGWEVTAASRGGGADPLWPEGVRTARVDRTDTDALAAALGGGVDVLLDCVAYDAGDARQLLSLADRIGSAVVISSAAVYQDEAGRNFDTQEEPDGFPRYPVPLPESCGTAAPGADTYGTRKVALEQELLAAGDRLPTTLLRAGAIHGSFSPMPRELYFAKRALDGRPVRVLSYGGASRFHPVHTANIAELVRLAARRPGSRVLNAGDPEVPTVAGIAAAVDEVLGAGARTVLVDGPPPSATVGDSPWSVPYPIVLDMAAAERELGYRAVTSYEESLPGTVEWLADAVRGGDWRAAFPVVARLSDHADWFDYAAEDAWLAETGR